jgi:hypothetical protein
MFNIQPEQFDFRARGVGVQGVQGVQEFWLLITDY